MILLYVPEGEFLMGSANSDPDALTRHEKPQHTVYLDAFWIDQTEVTVAMYAKCVASGKCQTPWCLTGQNSISTRQSVWIGSMPKHTANGRAGACQPKRSGKRQRGGQMADFIHGGMSLPRVSMQ